MIQTETERKILNAIQEEKTQWENAQIGVSDNVSINFKKDVLSRVQKNYRGIFDDPKFSDWGGKEKIWVHLTRSFVEGVVKSVDLDLKDINVRAKKPDARGTASIVRQVIRYYLQKIGFSELLDELERACVNEGTAVVKIWRQKKDIKIKIVSLWNCFIDAGAESIQKAPAFIERALLQKNEVEAYKDIWENVDAISFHTDFTQSPFQQLSALKSAVPMVDVWERWGLQDVSWRTGKDEDKDKWEEGHIIISGIEANKPVVHLIEKNDEPRPYEEVWLRKVNGVWYGIGIGEDVMGYQRGVNEIKNEQWRKVALSNLGLLKYKKTSGITPAVLARLANGGAIPVNQMDDIMPLQLAPVLADSDRMIDDFWSWAQRVTQAFDISVGETLPASTPATNAIIQNQNAKSAFVLMQKALGHFLQRLIGHHLIPMLKEIVKDEEILRIAGSPGELKEIDEHIINHLLYEQVAAYVITNRMAPDATQIEQERLRMHSTLTQTGDQRYVRLRKDIFDAEYDIEVYVANDEIDKGVMLQNMDSLMANGANLLRIPGHTTNIDFDEIMREKLDILGLSGQRFFKSQPFTAPQQQGAPGQQLSNSPPPQAASNNPQRIFAQANIPQQ